MSEPVKEPHVKQVFLPVEGEKVVNMMQYQDIMLVATDKGLWACGDKEKVEAFAKRLHFAELPKP